MEQICEDWEIVNQKTEHPLLWVFTHLMLAVIFWAPGVPRSYSRATWTVRQASTGAVKRVTADNKSEAADLIVRGLFDPS
jgi:hypothetical protein